MGLFDNLRGKPARPRVIPPRRPGRPKGAKNKPKPTDESTPLAAVVDRHLTKLYREDREAYREAVMLLIRTYAETVIPQENEDPAEMYKRLRKEHAKLEKLFGPAPTPGQQFMEQAIQAAGEILKGGTERARPTTSTPPAPSAKPTAATSPPPTDPWAALAPISMPPMGPTEEGGPPE